jgi:hypothetical protein
MVTAGIFAYLIGGPVILVLAVKGTPRIYHPTHSRR